jgi:glutathione S-transferase
LPEPERDPEMLQVGRRRFHHYASTLEDVLDGHEYLCGDEFTAADIVVGYALHLAAHAGALPAECEKLSAYYGRLAARPAFKKATL